MRILLLALALAPALSASAQQPAQPAPAPPPVGSNWQHVQALPIGAFLDIKATKSHLRCKLKNVDSDSLTCAQGKDIVLQRTDIITIKVPHRGRSTLIGLAIGGGVGAGVGAGITAGTSCKQLCIVSSGDVIAVTSAVGGILGAITGVVTDFTRSTVYKAP